MNEHGYGSDGSKLKGQIVFIIEQKWQPAKNVENQFLNMWEENLFCSNKLQLLSCIIGSNGGTKSHNLIRII